MIFITEEPIFIPTHEANKERYTLYVHVHKPPTNFILYMYLYYAYTHISHTHKYAHTQTH